MTTQSHCMQRCLGPVQAAVLGSPTTCPTRIVFLAWGGLAGMTRSGDDEVDGGKGGGGEGVEVVAADCALCGFAVGDAGDWGKRFDELEPEQSEQIQYPIACWVLERPLHFSPICDRAMHV